MKALKTKVWSVVKLRLVNELANPEQQRSQNKRVSETVDVRVGDLLLKKDACYHSTNRFDSPETSLRTNLAILRPTVCFFGPELPVQKPEEITADVVLSFSNFI